MREMKDSGIDWIGNIPKEWNIIPIRYLVGDCFSGSWGDDPQNSEYDLECLRIADFDFDKLTFKSNIEYTRRNYSLTDIATKALKYGDLCIEKSGGGDKTPVGRTVIFRGYSPVLFANFLNCIRLNHLCHIEFGKYLFAISYYNGVTRLYLNQTTGIQNLNIQKYFREVSFPVPAIQEQKRIASFLDSKCSEIDYITTDIRKEIETLQEYRKSMITEAITKGLDPNVEMKDSGIVWIGMIPKHWEVNKIKYNLHREDLKNPGEMPVLSLYRDYGVIPKDSRDDNHNVTSEDISKYKYVKKGSFVINKMKAWQGSVAVSEYQGVVSPAYYVYKFDSSTINKDYFHYLMRSCYKDEFRRLSGGIREGQWDLASEDLDNTLIIIPPLNEQKQIVLYIDSKCYEIDSIIEDKQNQLATLAEYRKSLIYEYVTGKKEVPAV